jgi:flagellar assembly protein FliH
MAQPVKFTFDTSFGTRRMMAQPKVEAPPPAPAEPPPPPPPTFSEEELAAARAQAHAEGLAAGRAEVMASVEKASADLLGAIAAKLGELGQNEDAAREQVRAEAAKLALAIARRLARNLLAREPEVEVEAMIATCLGDLGGEPRIVVRVPEAMVEAMSEKVTGLAARAGFNGQVMLLGEPSLGPADCRIEWTDGGASRSQDEIEAQVAAAIERYAATAPGAPAATN